MESKTEGTIWKSIQNCVRDSCQKWPCILFWANCPENKQWPTLFLLVGISNKRYFQNGLLIRPLASPLWLFFHRRLRQDLRLLVHPQTHQGTARNADLSDLCTQTLQRNVHFHIEYYVTKYQVPDSKTKWNYRCYWVCNDPSSNFFFKTYHILGLQRQSKLFWDSFW